MTTSRCLHDAYGDLLSRGADPSDLEIVAALDRGFSPARTRIPPARVFTTIDQVVEAHRARLRRRWWRPAVPKLRQPLPLVLAVLVVLLLAGAGYRAVPLLERAFDGDQGAHYVMTEHLATPLDLSQTSNGYTLTLKGAYADANQVLLVLTLHGPDTIPPLAEFSIFPDTRLIDAGGAAISPDSGGNMSEGGVASVTYAITSPLDANTLHLHWVIPHLRYLGRWLDPRRMARRAPGNGHFAWRADCDPGRPRHLLAPLPTDAGHRPMDTQGRAGCAVIGRFPGRPTGRTLGVPLHPPCRALALFIHEGETGHLVRGVG